MSSTARVSPARHPEVTLGGLLALGPSLLRRISGAHLVWALLVAATLPWRKGVYYEGGADSVVVAKALLSLVALMIAVHLAGGARRIVGVPAAPVLLVFVYLAVTVVGGYVHGTLVAAAVVAVRVAILCVTITLLFTHYPPLEIARSLVHVLGLVLAAGTVSGLPSAEHGRLAGAVPPLNPNEVAFLAAVCFFWVFARMMQARESTTDLVVAVVTVGIVVLTGSRAGLAALSVAVVIVTVRATALTRRSFALVSLLGPLMAYVAFGTDLLSSVFLRGGERGVTTLSNRTIAWDAALNSDHDPWESWFGSGLAQKKIEVPGQWWNTQLLDSSWVSALVQGGLVGVTLVLLLTLTTWWRALTTKAPTALWLGLVTFVAGRAVLESGLFDSSTAFMVFFVAALGARLPADHPVGVDEPTPTPEPAGASASR
jgi:hypothetical protein